MCAAWIRRPKKMERCMRKAAGAPVSHNTALVAAAAMGATVVLALAVEPRIVQARPDAPFASPCMSVPRVLVLGVLVGSAAGGVAWWYSV